MSLPEMVAPEWFANECESLRSKVLFGTSDDAPTEHLTCTGAGPAVCAAR